MIEVMTEVDSLMMQANSFDPHNAIAACSLIDALGHIKVCESFVG